MIRPHQHNDVEAIRSIWLRASAQHEDFVLDSLLSSEPDTAEEFYKPNVETWVYEVGDDVRGFLALEQETLKGLYIAPEDQGHGHGAELLTYAKTLREELTLRVPVTNQLATRFYKQQGFEAVGEDTDDISGERAVVMRWKHN